jgi:hypothetical protein
LREKGEHALVRGGPERGGYLFAAAGDRIKDGTNPHPVLQFFQHRSVSAFPNGTKTDNA